MKKKHKKKKILLVYHYNVVEPVSILFLQNYVDKNGHDADLIDWQSISNDFDFRKYDFVGFSILSGSHNQMFKIADEIKNKNLETKVIIGNAHTIFFANECKKHSDFVIRGFGERLLVDILNEDIAKEGIYSEKTPPKDLLILDREKLYVDEKRRNNPIKNIITSYCCPYRCNYCYNSIVQEEFPEYRYTTRPVDSVIEECKVLLKYPLKLIFFQDDTFGVNLKWLREFAQAYKREINIPFHCNTKIDLANDKRINLYKEAGCESVTFSIECASDELRRILLKKPITNQQIYEGVDILRKYGITFRTQQMLGLPKTTIEDDLNLLEMSCKIKPLLASATIFTPMMGTPLTEQCIRDSDYDPKNEVDGTLFGRSVLNFSEKRKDQITLLHKLFAVLSHIPNGAELGRKLTEKNDFNLHNFYNYAKFHLFDVMYHLDSKDARETRAENKNG